ncbi:sulfatase family protein [Rubritalea marina]|uniref:sulfatase family protein n=1 Tax=Rubritalea marina TaxID=361055 RepID=UPI0003A5F6A6|nr:sulfatase-like hydrolase/transferase [Rubritalea marina]
MKKTITTLVAGLLTTLMSVGEEKPPNIVVIISDDQAYHDYSFMGHEVIETPHIDKLAEESLLYERGYVTTALCCPSLATMLTGMYPHQHGYTGNDPQPYPGERHPSSQLRNKWADHFKTMPQFPALLQKADYLSLHTGKYWQGHPSVSGFTHNMGATMRNGSKKSLNIGREGLQPIYDFIEEAQGQEKPFMVWYAAFMPHTPHTPPERLYEKYIKKGCDDREAKYFAMVDWFDETCGELLAHLDEKQLTEDTVIFYICDNGWPTGAKGYRGHKLTPYEQGVRTPIMIKWPGKVQAKRDTVSLASNLDLVPTLLNVAGVDAPEVLEGIDLLDRKAVAQRKAIFLEDFTHDMVAPDNDEGTIEARGIVKGFWKYLETYDRDPKTLEIKRRRNFLFDLEKDPMEKKDLLKDNPELVKKLKKEMDDWYDPIIR